MKTDALLKEFRLEGKVLSIILSDDELASVPTEGLHCSLEFLNRAFAGDTIVINSSNLSCPGAERGFGFSDACPSIPGGFGYFISYGAGEGFMEGERIKKDPETAMEMLRQQPVDVLGDRKSIIIKKF